MAKEPTITPDGTVNFPAPLQMVKEPTSPPAGFKKPQPPPNVPSKQGVVPPIPTYRKRSNWPALPATPDPVGGLVVTTEQTDEPGTPMFRATFEGGRTSDPGYEPPSRTNEESPDCVPVTPTLLPQPPAEAIDDTGHLFIPPDCARGEFREVSPRPGPPDFEGTIYEPYAIIKDMRALYTDFVNDVMDATSKLRSGAFKWLCRAIALPAGSAVLILLAIGAVGVVGAVALFKVLDWAEYRYWMSTPDSILPKKDYVPRERPWK